MIQLEVWGPYALFTRGEMKVERVSYDVPTPSAARGIVESLYYHPGIRWHIRRIYVLNPIEFTTIRRNEVKNKILGSTAMRIAQGKEDEPYLVTTKQIVQRASMVLTSKRSSRCCRKKPHPAITPASFKTSSRAA